MAHSCYKSSDIAIVSMGGRLPGSESIDDFWNKVKGAVDCSSDTPKDRWYRPDSEVLSPEHSTPDRLVSKRGYFLNDWTASSDGLAIDSNMFDKLDPAFKLTLYAAKTALDNTNLSEIKPERIGAIFGNLALPSESSANLARNFIGQIFKEKITGKTPTSKDFLPENHFVNGLPSSILCKALNIKGTSYTIDAACASSLYAIKYAIDELRSYRADAMISGGISRPDYLYTQMGFSQLKALSPIGKSSPFDKSGKGLLVGEGGVLFVLKRLEDALKAGDQIHGVIKSVGLSNDIEGGLLAPSNEGQIRSMESAYKEAGWRADEVDYIECHATGTPLGDGVEFKSLETLWKGHKRTLNSVVIGSVKANVGHMLTAAGASGLTRVLLAMKHKTLPPTANYTEPASTINLNGSPFNILKQAAPWMNHGNRPRRAAISGFGFGGINAHLLVEEWDESYYNPSKATSPSTIDRQVAIIGIGAELSSDSQENPSEKNWRGADKLKWPASIRTYADNIKAIREKTKSVTIGSFAIPPIELQQMQPQQLYALLSAMKAARQAGIKKGPKPRSAVYMGIALDSEIQFYNARWNLANIVDEICTEFHLNLSSDDKKDWTEKLRKDFGPSLNANRTMGGLGGIVASRIARELQMGASGFTVSSEDTSGMRAFELGFRGIKQGELDVALVGGVDILSTLQHQICRSLIMKTNDLTTEDGAVSFVLKDLELARKDGNEILAIVEDCQSMTDFNPRTKKQSGEVFHGAFEGLKELYDSAISLNSKLGRGGKYLYSNKNNGKRSQTIETSSFDGTRSIIKLSEYIAPQKSALTPSQIIHNKIKNHGLFFFSGNNLSDLKSEALSIQNKMKSQQNITVYDLAAWFYKSHPYKSEDSVRAAIYAFNLASLEKQTDLIMSAKTLEDIKSHECFLGNKKQFRSGDELAFLYPGSGTHYKDMGKNLLSLFPNILESYHSEVGNLKDQLTTLDGNKKDSQGAKFAAHASVSILMTKLLDSFNIKPKAVIGYSLGESCALLATGAWRNPEKVFEKTMNAPLFEDLLGGDKKTIADAWGTSAEEKVDWGCFLVRQSPEVIKSLLSSMPNVYLSCINSPKEVVISGNRRSLVDIIRKEKLHAFEIVGTIATHASVIKGCEKQYRAFHNNEINPRVHIDHYSCSFARTYPISETAISDSLWAHGVKGVNFRDTLLEAHKNGLGIFIDIGPTATLTRLVSENLSGKNYKAMTLLENPSKEVENFFISMAKLFTLGLQVDLASMYENADTSLLSQHNQKPAIDIKVELDDITVSNETISVFKKNYKEPIVKSEPIVSVQIDNHSIPKASTQSFSREVAQSQVVSISSQQEGFQNMSQSKPPVAPVEQATKFNTDNSLIGQAINAEESRQAAHFEHMNFQNNIITNMGLLLQNQLDLLKRSYEGDNFEQISAEFLNVQNQNLQPSSHEVDPNIEKSWIYAPINPETPWLDYKACSEIAIGKIGNVLGEDFKEVDSYPTRVRLPDGPLLLCHRMMKVEAEAKSLKGGRLITEHDIYPDAWYLENGRIPMCIAVEAGQADLFLSGYLGADFHTKGKAVYRLLDAVNIFHDELPSAGKVIRYDIRIDHFFTQGQKLLFKFNFEATVDGKPFMSMRDGCAGFFTPEELAAGKGIVKSTMDLKEIPGKVTGGFEHLAPIKSKEAYSDQHLSALRAGDLAGCYGSKFSGLPINNPHTIPDGRMKLVHRILELDPTGGRFGLGKIVGEADIRPDDWFLTCHFVDDMVMPGTLMYECCLHTLRILTMRWGWVGDNSEMTSQPVIGNGAQLKCRGQVTQETQKVWYELTPKEIGYSPDAYVIADALMYADGKPVVEINNLSIRHPGFTKDKFESIWSSQPVSSNTVQPTTATLDPNGYYLKPALYTYEQICAYSSGKPSEGFGEPYKIFDGQSERRLARLPRDPYQFLDRVTAIDAQPWEVKAGGTIEAQYDVPRDAWYFDSEGGERMPFAVLLEIALQPCGWFSAFMGCALTSEENLRFRNLGGRSTQFIPVGRDIGTLTTTIHCTNISMSGGMIILDFNMKVCAGAGDIVVYDGKTTFGFFTDQALGQQLGIREPKLWMPSENDLKHAQTLTLPTGPAFPSGMISMLDKEVTYLPQGGNKGLGFISGTKEVNSSEWYFDAHFYEDPVTPGSLGLETMQQLLKIAATMNFGSGKMVGFDSIALNKPHEWMYRGQVIPKNKKVTVDVEITDIDQKTKTITANGYLRCDGITIYGMKDFSVTVREG